MKIAMIGHKRIPGRSGGVEVVVEELSTRMAEKGHDVTVYNRRCSEEKIDSYKKVKVVEVKTFQHPSLNAVVYSFFATLKCVFKKYDVVHYHAEGPCAMIPIAKLFGKKVVATIHGLNWQSSKWEGFASKFIKFGEKMAAKHADKVIVLSENVRRYFKETYGCDTLFIPNGIGAVTPEEPDIIAREFGLSKDSYILFLARITPEKGLDYLIDAYKSIDTDKKLVIAGGITPETEYISSVLKRAEGCDNIIFTDFVSGKVFSELFSNCYLYILPSDNEGMPLSLLEAMSYGNCCVVSDIPECAEVVEDKAVVFQKGNVVELKKTLQGLLDESDKVQKYKSEAADFICQKYNWDDVVDRTLEIYRG